MCLITAVQLGFRFGLVSQTHEVNAKLRTGAPKIGL